MAFDQKKYLDLAGLQSYDAKIKAKINAADQAINEKIGTVPEGKNLAQMVADEEARAKAAELENKTAVAEEKNRAEAAEQTLTNSIANEKTRAEAAEKANADAIAAEVTRAKGVEGGLQSNLEIVAKDLLAETERAEAAEQANADAIAATNAKIGDVPAEKTVVQMIADAQTAATYDDTQVKADIAKNAKDIADEKTRAEGKEAELVQAIADEKTRAEGKEAELAQSVTDEKTRAEAKELELANAIAAEKAKVDKLIGDDVDKSVRTIANEELAKQLIPEGAQESLDTLAEIAAWIQDHPDDVAAINLAIDNLEALVGAIPEDATATDIVGYIAEVVAAEKARAEGVEGGLNTRLQAVEAAVGEGGSVGTQIDAKIAELDADVTSATVEEGKGVQVQVVEVDGKVTTVAVTGNYDNAYDAKGAAATVKAEAEADATAKADAAQANAISTAAADATSKAEAAVTSANSYADGLYANIQEIPTSDIEALFQEQPAE